MSHRKRKSRFDPLISLPQTFTSVKPRPTDLFTQIRGVKTH